VVNEDTQTIEQDNEALIAEMLSHAERVELPSELSQNPVVHKGDEALPAPMTVKELSSAGYVYVWETRSYERIPILFYMLSSKLRQRRPDGSYRFTTVAPKEKPFRGTTKCLLHPLAENRKHFDDLGFRVCNKSNITNPHQLRLHMMHRHPQEWAAIEQERIDMERQEDRALQRLLLSNQMKQEKVEEPPVYVSDNPAKPKSKPKGRPKNKK